MNKKLVISGGLALVLIAAGAGYFFLSAEDEPLTLYGNVDIREVDLGFRVSGRLEEMQFEEGDAIAKGALLAVLDAEPYQHKNAMAKARRDAEAANLVRLEKGTRAEEIEQARALVEEREATLANLQLRYERQSRLVRSGATSREAFDEVAAARREAQARLNSAKEALDLAEEGFRDEDIDAGRASLAMAEAEFADAERQLADTRLHAPADGVILARVREPGAIVAEGAAVYTLSLESPVWVHAYIPETDLGDVWPGRKVRVYTDSRPDPYEGTVGFISPQAEFTPKSVETEELRTSLVYRLRVIVPEPDKSLRQGMPVTVRLDEGDARLAARNDRGEGE